MTHAKVRSEIGDLLAARNPKPNDGDQRLATLDFPSGPSLSRVRCIALLALSSEQQVIFRMAPNPNPNDLSIPLGCERAMMQPYAG